MELQHSIETGLDPNVILERIIQYYQSVGYKQENLSPISNEGRNKRISNLRFRRGSGFGSWTAFTPRGWKAIADVEITEYNNRTTTILVQMTIDTSGQMVTDAERAFWASELNDLDTSINDGIINSRASTDTSGKALQQNLLGTVLLYGLSVIGSILGFLIVFLSTHSILLSLLGVIIGSLSGTGIGFLILHYWMNLKRDR